LVLNVGALLVTEFVELGRSDLFAKNVLDLLYDDHHEAFEFDSDFFAELILCFFKAISAAEPRDLHNTRCTE
jgi:hypothetical protein